MVYRATTAVPADEGELGIVKSLSFTEADTFPIAGWVPPVDKRIVIDDILLSVAETSAKRAIFELQIFRNSVWETIGRVGQVGNGFSGMNHAFAGKLNSDKGDGSAARMRINKPGAANTTGFFLGVVIVGREV